ncbi:MAG: hypothetical protein ACE5I8_04400 [Thermodesulfobacteriota bacterium]
MPEHKVDFKFSIGDFVTMKGMSIMGKGMFAAYPQKGVVSSMWAEFCPGGIQKHYAIRWMAHAQGQWGIPKDLFKHNEVELVPWKEEFDKQEN